MDHSITRQSITAEAAETAIRAAVTQAEADGVSMTIAIVDESGVVVILTDGIGRRNHGQPQTVVTDRDTLGAAPELTHERGNASRNGPLNDLRRGERLGPERVVVRHGKRDRAGVVDRKMVRLPV